MREQLPFFQTWPPFPITAEVKAKRLMIRPATINRAVQTDKKKPALKGISGTKPGNLLKKHIPVQTQYPWDERIPGFFELTRVHHREERDARQCEPSV
ncbi:MAG: hypothetical protein LBD93_09540 [Treponema sp.]|jgi:hypothetical protein|nr:hypothetical protein [Treponema sp.]